MIIRDNLLNPILVERPRVENSYSPLSFYFYMQKCLLSGYLILLYVYFFFFFTQDHLFVNYTLFDHNYFSWKPWNFTHFSKINSNATKQNEKEEIPSKQSHRGINRSVSVIRINIRENREHFFKSARCPTSGKETTGVTCSLGLSALISLMPCRSFLIFQLSPEESFDPTWAVVIFTMERLYVCIEAALLINERQKETGQ